jgi:hypothetical protein
VFVQITKGARGSQIAVVASTVVLGLVGAGCGSKSHTSSTSSSSGSSSSGASSSGTTKHYRAGEFCSQKKASIYAAQGLTCASNGHLKKK